MLFLLCLGKKANIQIVSGTPKVSEPLRYNLALWKSLIRFSAGSLDILRLPLGSFDDFQANISVVLPTSQKKNFLLNSFKSPFISYSSNRHTFSLLFILRSVSFYCCCVQISVLRILHYAGC
jgi:hypothetical protein